MNTDNIPDELKAKVALICYSNVLGLFARFHNSRHKNYDWTGFVDLCVDESSTWMLSNFHGERNFEVKELFKIYAREIAEDAISKMTT